MTTTKKSPAQEYAETYEKLKAAAKASATLGLGINVPPPVPRAYPASFVRRNVELLQASVKALETERDTLAAELRAARAEIERLRQFEPQAPEGIVPETLAKVQAAYDSEMARCGRATQKAICIVTGLARSTVQTYLKHVKK